MTFMCDACHKDVFLTSFTKMGKLGLKCSCGHRRVKFLYAKNWRFR